MNPSPKEKYSARLTELEALHHELAGGKRPGDGGVVVGLLLEAAGDLLRRQTALGVAVGSVTGRLQAIPESALRAWGEGVQATELVMRLRRAATHAVESAIPDEDGTAESSAQWAVQDLQARDRLESALTALETLVRDDARALLGRLRREVTEVDRSCRGTALSLTSLNVTRRAEAALLDASHRNNAWWFSAHSGMEEDEMVRVLGGTASGTLPPSLRAVSSTVERRRERPVTSDDLFRFDLGLASPAEREAIRLQASRDPELKLALAAMEAAESAILDESRPASAETTVLTARSPDPVERKSAPEVVEQRPEFKVLVFRTKQSVQVVVQPQRLDRFAAAAVFRGDDPDRAVPSRPGDMGLHFDLGSPERVAGTRARVVVKLVDGQTHAVDVSV